MPHDLAAEACQGEWPAAGIIADQAHRSFGNEHHLVGEAIGLQQGLACAVAQPLQMGALGGENALQRNRKGAGVLTHGKGIKQRDPGSGLVARSVAIASVSH